MGHRLEVANLHVVPVTEDLSGGPLGVAARLGHIVINYVWQALAVHFESQANIESCVILQVKNEISQIVLIYWCLVTSVSASNTIDQILHGEGLLHYKPIQAIFECLHFPLTELRNQLQSWHLSVNFKYFTCCNLRIHLNYSIKVYIRYYIDTLKPDRSAYFVVHIAGHQGGVDSGVTPWVRLHAISTLSSQTGC